MSDESNNTGKSKSYNDYDNLLETARDEIPDEISEHDRFEIPDLDILQEGNTTIFRNFNDVADQINRSPEKFLKFLLGELGTAGERENGRVVFKGKINSSKIKNKIEDYVEKYVLCPECGRPDTRLVKEDRVDIIKCDACGAHGPIRGKQSKSTSSPKSERIEEGEIYELMIQDIGREGDGMAKKGGYTIYVPGTTKGDKVKVRINNTTGNLAFGTVVDK
ncbi:MAG: translation initiation factor IF-2 subunit beta [Candidatus Thermoplasmatota archaeon]|nr:translation initiation factor IF-2 subunit beta [Candidatus Thermoplasmatota archaeon]MBS3790344.1 translation initiation factor IF-2 subunit beta [Candidatus Thermoplasmatota archaeon]